MKKLLLIAVVVLTTIGFAMAQSGNVEGLNVGNKLPDMAFKTPDGKMLSLSALKGKIVLVDFWASWCRPCRAENPNVVAAYNKYKDAKYKTAKGFDIYSVSLDNNVDAWKNAIKQDGLLWPGHVSDLLQWQSAAVAKYKIEGIPTNFLIDENGIIIAKSLRGATLEAELEKLIKK